MIKKRQLKGPARLSRLRNVFISVVLLCAIGAAAQSVKVTPANWYKGKTLSVTIAGNKTHFKAGAGTTVVKFRQASNTVVTTITPNSFTAVNDTVISANVTVPTNVSTGYYDGLIADATDGTITQVNTVWVNDKTTIGIAKVYPDSIRRGQTLSVAITGKNTNFGIGGSTTTVWFQQGASTIINPSSISIAGSNLLYASTTVNATAATGYYDVYVKNSLDTTIVFVKGIYVSGSALPAIKSFSPDTSSLGQVIKFSVTGTNTRFGKGLYKTVALLSGTKNAKDTIPGYNYTISSAGSLTCYFSIPKNVDSGDYELKIFDTYDGTLTASSKFHIASKTRILSVNPATGFTGSTVTLTITGYQTDFSSGAGPAVWISQGTNKISASKIISVKPDTIKAEFTIPALASTGKYSVNITETKDSFLTLADAFYVYANNVARITAVSPSKANAAQSFTCSISTQGTKYKTDGISAIWLEKGAQIISSKTSTIVNDTTVSSTFTIPSNASGLYSLFVKSGKGDTLSLFNAVNIAAVIPEIVSISPGSALQKQKISVAITGNYTAFQSGNDSVWLSNGGDILHPLSYSITNDSSVIAVFDIGSKTIPGLWDVNVRDLKDKTLTLSKGFTVNKALPASVVSITPDSSKQGFSVSATISGANTYFSSDSLAVLLRKGTQVIKGTALQVKSDNIVVAKFSIPFTADTGQWNLEVTDIKDSTMILVHGFYISKAPPPFITLVNPDSVKQGKTLFIQMFGFATSFKASKTDVNFSNGTFSFTAASIRVFTAVQLRSLVNIPSNCPTGYYDVIVSDSADGTMIKKNGLYIAPADINAPLITSVQPDSAYRFQALQVMVRFKKTKLSTEKLRAFYKLGPDSIFPSGITILNDTALKLTLKISGNAVYGSYDLHVNGDSDGIMVYASALFIRPKPKSRVLSVNPDSAMAGVPVKIQVEGRSTIFDSTVGFYIEKNGIKYDAIIDTINSDSSVWIRLSIPANAALGAYTFNAKDTADSIITADIPFYVIHNTSINPFIEKRLKVSAQPNPFRDVLSIDIESAYSGMTRIEIVDICGKVVSELPQTDHSTGHFNYRIDFRSLGLKPGVYLIRCTQSVLQKTIRVIYQE
jgi:hypothetical protein